MLDSRHSTFHEIQSFVIEGFTFDVISGIMLQNVRDVHSTSSNLMTNKWNCHLFVEFLFTIRYAHLTCLLIKRHLEFLFLMLMRGRLIANNQSIDFNIELLFHRKNNEHLKFFFVLCSKAMPIYRAKNKSQRWYFMTTKIVWC